MPGFIHSFAVLLESQNAKAFLKNQYIYYTDGKAGKQSSTEESKATQSCSVNNKVIMSH